MALEQSPLIVPRQDILTTRARTRSGGDGRDLQRRRERGELVQLRRGVYLSSSVWNQLDDRRRHIAVMQAVQSRHRTPLVFCLDSAAAALGYPAYGLFGTVPHVMSQTERSSTPRLTWHYGKLRDEDVLACGGFYITSPARTLADIARTSPFARAVGMLDAGIRTRRIHDDTKHAERASIDELKERIAVFEGKRGYRRAVCAIEFARDGADSLGESISRVQEYVNGFPEPELQYEVRDQGGRIGFADQAWPDYRLLGEFDGYAKYTRDQYTKGRPIEDIVFDEKKREDRMRATGLGMARWLWDDAHRGTGLVAILTRVGLPRRQRRGFGW